MTTLGQPLKPFAVAKMLFFTGLAVAPFLAHQMQYQGKWIDLFGAMPGLPFYVVGYLAALNFVDQMLVVIYVRPYRAMPEQQREKWKRVMAVLGTAIIISVFYLVRIATVGSASPLMK